MICYFYSIEYTLHNFYKVRCYLIKSNILKNYKIFPELLLIILFDSYLIKGTKIDVLKCILSDFIYIHYIFSILFKIQNLYLLKKLI
jgi:hypothetical protein